MNTGFVPVDGIPVHYKRAGCGAPVVLLHGSGAGDLRDWDLTLFEAIAAGHDTIAFDRPGVGQSGRPGGADDPLVQADILKRAAQALAVERPVLLGHSFGGTVALAWGTLGPQDVAGMVLAAPAAYPLDNAPDPMLAFLAIPHLGPVLARAICGPLRKAALKKSVAPLFAPLGMPDGFMDAMGRHLFSNPQELCNNATEITRLKGFLPAIIAKYPGLDMPVEILYGTADKNTPPDVNGALVSALPDANLVMLEGLGHMLQYQASDEILLALDRVEQKNAQNR